MSAIHVHIPYPKVGEYLTFIKQKRLNLEILFPSSTLDAVRTTDIKRLREDLGYDPSLSIHAPFMDLSPGAVDEKVRAVTEERFFQILSIAEILSPKVIVFHSGYEKWKYSLKTEPWLERSLITWEQVNKRAVEIGVKIAIENIFEDEPTNLRTLMEGMNSNNFGICFDTGHYNLFSKVKLEAWLDSLHPYIFEFHVHDNDRTSDSHLPIGDGTFDFQTLFSFFRDRDCIYTIEAHTPEGVMKSIERLRDTVPSEVNEQD